MEQFKCSVPVASRVHGWLYDVNSGVCMGIGSDEQRALHGYNTVFDAYMFGCKYNVTIHASRTAVVHIAEVV